jgi:maleamate amidohydrolase
MELTFWDGFLSPEEHATVIRGRYGRRHGLGIRPALLLVDLQLNYLGADAPILDQLDRFPSGVGERAWRAGEQLMPVLAAARRALIPVIYTVVRQKRNVIAGANTVWGMVAGLDRPSTFMTDEDPGARIVESLAPDETRGEIVLVKNYPSAFFATPLTSYLVKAGVDTLLIAGGTTSGCVRSTAVDASSLNYNVAIIADCVFDRIQHSHMSSLLDVWMKYGAVVDSSAAIAYLDGATPAASDEADGAR